MTCFFQFPFLFQELISKVDELKIFGPGLAQCPLCWHLARRVPGAHKSDCLLRYPCSSQIIMAMMMRKAHKSDCYLITQAPLSSPQQRSSHYQVKKGIPRSNICAMVLEFQYLVYWYRTKASQPNQSGKRKEYKAGSFKLCKAPPPAVVAAAQCDEEVTMCTLYNCISCHWLKSVNFWTLSWLFVEHKSDYWLICKVAKVGACKIGQFAL